MYSVEQFPTELDLSAVIKPDKANRVLAKCLKSFGWWILAKIFFAWGRVLTQGDHNSHRVAQTTEPGITNAKNLQSIKREDLRGCD